MQVFIVIRAGKYASEYDGKKIASDRVELVAGFTQREPADKLSMKIEDVPEGWEPGVSQWVDSIMLDEAPLV